MGVGLPARSVSPFFSIGTVQRSKTVAVPMAANERLRSPGPKVHGTEIFPVSMRLRGQPHDASAPTADEVSAVVRPHAALQPGRPPCESRALAQVREDGKSCDTT